MQWQKIAKQDHVVDYENHPPPDFRLYGHPGRVHVEGNDITLEPVKGQLNLFLVFTACFIPVFSGLAYFLINDDGKWLFVFAGPGIGVPLFSLIYYILKRDVDAGPYMRFLSQSDEIVLPRLGLRFDRRAVTLQWITGRLRDDSDINTDLNLIVADGDEKRRYFVMGGPMRSYIRQFAEQSGVPVEEVDLGWKGRRDLDRNSQLTT